MHPVTMVTDLQRFGFLLLMIPAAVMSERLECYRCTYFDIESDHIILGAFFDLISATSNTHCPLKEERDITEIGRVFCPEPDDDKESKCLIIKGEVKGKLNLYISEVDFQYYTVTRDCVVVKKGEFPDGCYDELPSSGPVRTVFENTLEGYDLGDIKFKGHACYYNHLTTGAQAISASVIQIFGLVVLTHLCFVAL